MKRFVLFLLLATLMMGNAVYAQRTLKTESDGFQWYWEQSADGKEFRAVGLDGRELVPYNYLVTYDKDNGVFIVVRSEEDVDNARFGYYSRRGNVISLPGQYDYSVIVNMDRKFVKIKKDGLEGALDLEGRVIVPPVYDECMFYSLKQSNGYIQYFGVKKRGKEGAYDLKGKMIIPVKYDKLRYKDWETNANGFEGVLGNDNNYKSLNISLPVVYSAEKIRDLFTKASKETDATKKINLYSEIIKYDSYNSAGVNSFAYNNLGVAYENIGDYNKAKVCFENAYKIDSSNKTAFDNLQNVKRNIRNDAFDRALSFFGYISSILTSGNQADIGGFQGGDTYGDPGVGVPSSRKDIMTLPTTPTAYQDGEKIWRKDAGYGMIYVCKEKNGMRNETLYGLCKMCRGTKICSTCQGSRQCNLCQGKGGIVTSGYGQYLPCTACNRTGSCSLCQGTGRCSCTNYEYPGYTPGSTTLYDINGNIISTTSFTSGSSSSSSSESRSSHSSSSLTKSSCSRCHGIGVDPSPSSGGNLSAWVAHYNATGETCPYCNRVTEHWHTRCSTCNVPQ